MGYQDSTRKRKELRAFFLALQCGACEALGMNYRIEARDLWPPTQWLPVESEPLYLDEDTANLRADDLEDMAVFTTYRVVPTKELPHAS